MPYQKYQGSAIVDRWQIETALLNMRRSVRGTGLNLAISKCLLDESADHYISKGAISTNAH